MDGNSCTSTSSQLLKTILNVLGCTSIINRGYTTVHVEPLE